MNDLIEHQKPVLFDGKKKSAHQGAGFFVVQKFFL